LAGSHVGEEVRFLQNFSREWHSLYVEGEDHIEALAQGPISLDELCWAAGFVMARNIVLPQNLFTPQVALVPLLDFLTRKIYFSGITEDEEELASSLTPLMTDEVEEDSEPEEVLQEEPIAEPVAEQVADQETDNFGLPRRKKAEKVFWDYSAKKSEQTSKQKAVRYKQAQLDEPYQRNIGNEDADSAGGVNHQVCTVAWAEDRESTVELIKTVKRGTPRQPYDDAEEYVFLHISGDVQQGTELSLVARCSDNTDALITYGSLGDEAMTNLKLTVPLNSDAMKENHRQVGETEWATLVRPLLQEAQPFMDNPFSVEKVTITEEELRTGKDTSKMFSQEPEQEQKSETVWTIPWGKVGLEVTEKCLLPYTQLQVPGRDRTVAIDFLLNLLQVKLELYGTLAGPGTEPPQFLCPSFRGSAELDRILDRYVQWEKALCMAVVHHLLQIR